MADKGINSKINRRKITTDRRYDYIFASRLKNLIHELSANLLITYSPQRTQKDRADRERLIKKAKSQLENKSYINASNKRGGKIPKKFKRGKLGP